MSFRNVSPLKSREDFMMMDNQLEQEYNPAFYRNETLGKIQPILSPYQNATCK